MLFLIRVALLFSSEIGFAYGNNYTFKASQEIAFLTNAPLDLATEPKITRISNTVLYKYESLKLLTDNNGKYFVFKDIDPSTCKPEKVFVIEQSNLMSVTLGNSTPIDIDECLYKTTNILGVFPFPVARPKNFP